MTALNIPEVTLNDGLTLPAVGFGTYKMNGAAGVDGLVSAIDVGYRLLDSAFNYENEGAGRSDGRLIRASGYGTILPAFNSPNVGPL